MKLKQGEKREVKEKLGIQHSERVTLLFCLTVLCNTYEQVIGGHCYAGVWFSVKRRAGGSRRRALVERVGSFNTTVSAPQRTYCGPLMSTPWWRKPTSDPRRLTRPSPWRTSLGAASTPILETPPGDTVWPCRGWCGQQNAPSDDDSQPYTFTPGGVGRGQWSTVDCLRQRLVDPSLPSIRTIASSSGNGWGIYPTLINQWINDNVHEACDLKITQALIEEMQTEDLYKAR